MANSTMEDLSLKLLWEGLKQVGTGNNAFSIPNASSFTHFLFTFICDSGYFSAVVKKGDNFATNGAWFSQGYPGVNRNNYSLSSEGILSCTDSTTDWNGRHDSSNYTYLMKVIGMKL